MKYALLVSAFVLALSVTSGVAMADGCYMCSGGGYVAYTGDDTFDKRAKAESQYGCKVSGTTSSCSGAKGTVSSLMKQADELYACASDDAPADGKDGKDEEEDT